LRIKTGSRSSLQRTRSPCALCEAFAPIALQKHRNAVKKHANFFHTIPSRTQKKGFSHDVKGGIFLKAFSNDVK
jgi:hypothetical protein